MIDLERAVPALERLPRHPSPHAQVVRCSGRNGKCNQVVALIDDGVAFIRHQGGEWTVPLPIEARCSRCGNRMMITRAHAA